jgi:hypothetical protein
VRYYEDSYSEGEGTLVSIYIRADKYYDSYERTVVDILTLLGDIGGLKEFFMLIGNLFVGFIASKLFMSSIVKKIYHIRKYDNIQYESRKIVNEE